MKTHPITSNIVKAFIALSLAVCLPNISAAQEYENTPVEISKEKVRIGEQVCYSHIVLEKQTLYSICKAYNVNEEDIYRFNPEVKENGLKKNSILIIPIMTEQVKTAATQKVPDESKAPELRKNDNAPKEGKIQDLIVRSPKEPKIKRKIHTVKWYENIDDIAAKYGVSADAIMRANNLTERKLTKRQRLIIPNPGEYLNSRAEIKTDETPVAAEDTTAPADTAAAEKAKELFPELFIPKKKVDLALLLPLKATGTTSSRQNMDFYSGVLLAVYDMAKDGVSTNLNVFDIEEGKMPDKEFLKGSDVIIGPVAPNDIKRTFDASHSIKSLVSPLDPRAEHIAYSQKAMIQAPTPHATQYSDLVSWIKEELQPEDRVLLITEKGVRPSDAVRNMTVAIDSAGIEYKPLSYSILEGRNVTETLAWLMTETAANRVYIASESEAFVNDVVRNLNVMIHQKYNVILYAPSKIRSFETIEVENFHNTRMRVSTGYHIDYNDPKVMQFLLRYRALFNSEPTQFAYQGYDLAIYFIKLCSKYGNRWMEKLDEEKMSMLQSSFDFTETATGGYVNNAVRRIVYGDGWSVEKVR